MEERAHADLARNSKGGVLEAREQFKVLSPVKMRTQSEDLGDTRWVFTSKEVDGMTTVKARLGAISGSGSAQWQRGYCRLRESQIAAFAVDVSGSPKEVAALEP